MFNIRCPRCGKVPADTVCWALDSHRCAFDVDTSRRRIIVTDTVTNHDVRAVSDVRVYCDFYTIEGVYKCTVSGRLKGADRIEAGKAGDYRIILDGNKRGYAVGLIRRQTNLYLVGKQQ